MFIQAVLLTLALLVYGSPQAISQEESTSCGFVVISREEMKREIQAQVKAAMTGETTVFDPRKNGSVCSDNKTNDEALKEDNVVQLIKEVQRNITETIVDQVEEIFSEKLDQVVRPIMSKLISLHQPGKTPSHPATSCSEILEFDEATPSGYYWLKASDGSSVRMYCDMTRLCKGASGPWMKVAELDMTNSSNECPRGLRLVNRGGKRLCGINSDGPACSHVLFDNHGLEYSQVCGKIIAYQDKTPDAFRGASTSTIDQNYVDGVSLTYGRNPRRHIWTFMAALDEVGTCLGCNCPCTNVHQSPPQAPGFIGNDYFCDTASQHQHQFIFYPDDPLWDGQGCGPTNTCCSLNNPPWFLKQLPSATGEDIEMRVCGNEPRSNEDVPIETIELYVQ